MGLFDMLAGGDGKKKKAGSSNNNNPLANAIAGIGGGTKKGFKGAGQSLGGRKPGKVIPISLANPGPLGLQVERRPNSEGTAIVARVVEGSQAEAAGLQRGDVLCFAGSDGQEEIMMNMFLELAKSEQRPLHFDIRRIDTVESKAGTAAVPVASGNKSAEAYRRKQAMIAAAEAREKSHKAKSKPIPKINKEGKGLRSTEEQRQLEKERMAAMEAQTEPMSAEAQKAVQAAKASESALAAELGYNPYETARSSAGQARNATTTVTHGAISADGAGDHLPSSSAGMAPIPSVAAPADPVAASTDSEPMELSPEFEEAYTVAVSSNSKDTIKASFGIMRKLLTNATTKGQKTDDLEAAAKFRRVRLANPKIKAAIVDLTGGVEIMLSAGFQLIDEDGESYLVYPEGYVPEWLKAALQQMEQYENAT